MNRRNLRTAAVILRTDVKTSVRAVLDDPRMAIAWALAGVFFFGMTAVAFVVGLGTGYLLLGAETSIGGVSTALLGIDSGVESLGIGVLATAGAGAFVGLSSLSNGEGLGPAEVLLRTSVPTRVAIAANVVSQAVRTGGVLAVPSLAGVIGVGLGSGSVLVTVLGTAAAAALLATGFVLGRLVGGMGRYLVMDRVESVWIRIPLQGALALGTFLVVWGLLYGDSGLGDPIVAPLLEIGAAYATVILAPIGITIRPIGVVAFLSVPVVFGLGTAALLRLETRRLSQARSDGTTADTESRNVPGLFASRTDLGVAWQFLLRTARNPRLLSHLAFVFLYPVLFVPMFFVQGLFNWTLLSGMLVWMGVTLAGGAYCLNPFGDDRQQRPLLLTSIRSPLSALHGRAIAGVLLACPFVLLGLAVLPIDRSLAFVGGAALTVILLIGASIGTAMGFGTLLPKYERSEYMNVERIHPSIIATLLFQFGALVGVGAGYVLLWSSLTVDLGTVTVGGFWVGFVAIAGAPALLGYAYARRHSRRQTLEYGSDDSWLTG